MASTLGHVLAVAVFTSIVIVANQRIFSRSRVLGTIVAFTVLARLILGVALFGISYYQLPVAESLQLGGGFWQPALDSRTYFHHAAEAVTRQSLYPLDYAVPSPIYINVLACWMFLVGVSPLAGMFLNLCLYVTIVASVVWAFSPVNEWRRDLPAIVGVAAYSFSPVVLIHATQPLKDELFNTIVMLACVGVLRLSTLIYSLAAGRQYRAALVGGLLVTAAVFGAAGIRWYYAVIIWASLALTMTVFAVHGRTTPLVRYVSASLTVLVASLFAFTSASGPYAQLITGPIKSMRIWSIGSHLSSVAAGARVGFLNSGGGTNVVVSVRTDPGSDAPQANAAPVGAVHGVSSTETMKPPVAGAKPDPIMERPLPSAKAVEPVVGAPEAHVSTERRAPSASAVEPTVPGAKAGAITRAPVALPTAKPVVGAPQTAPKPAASPLTQPATDAETAAVRATPQTLSQYVKTAMIGLGLVTLPTFVMQSGFGVHVPSGRGLLFVADVDTLFMEATVLAVLALLWRRRRLIGQRLPFVTFAIILSATTAVLLGYVVTNFGTLWRMRPLAAVPLWLLVVALAPPREVDSPDSDHDRGLPDHPDSFAGR